MRAISISPACMSRRSSCAASTRSSRATGCCARRAPTAARPRSSRSSPGPGVELVGYEDSRTRFLGEGSMRAPTGCEPMRWRKLDDEGKLWTFDPGGELHASRPRSRADGEVEAEFIIGRADNAVWAAELIVAAARPAAAAGAATCRPGSTRRARSNRRPRCHRAGRSPSPTTAGRCISPIARRARGRM